MDRKGKIFLAFFVSQNKEVDRKIILSPRTVVCDENDEKNEIINFTTIAFHIEV